MTLLYGLTKLTFYYTLFKGIAAYRSKKCRKYW